MPFFYLFGVAFGCTHTHTHKIYFFYFLHNDFKAFIESSQHILLRNTNVVKVQVGSSHQCSHGEKLEKKKTQQHNTTCLMGQVPKDAFTENERKRMRGVRMVKNYSIFFTNSQLAVKSNNYLLHIFFSACTHDTTHKHHRQLSRFSSSLARRGGEYANNILN